MGRRERKFCIRRISRTMALPDQFLRRNMLTISTEGSTVRIRLLPTRQTRMFLMDWKKIYSLWSHGDQSDPAEEPTFQRVYSELWFQPDSRRERRFWIGHICYMTSDQPVSFVNGRHRTSVLAQFWATVPLAAHADIYRKKRFAGCIIREISKDEYFDLPDLPILSPRILTNLRTWDSPNKKL